MHNIEGLIKCKMSPSVSPNQVLRHARAARAAAKQLVAVIPDPRAARSLRFSPSARTVDGYHPSITK